MRHTITAVVGMLVMVSVGDFASAEETVASGTFVGASDHVTTGLVEVIKDGESFTTRLADDFSLDGAPDPKLGFGNDGTYDETTTFSDLDKLRGEQVYTIPASIDPSAYNEFYIWCEQFSVPLGVAALQ